MFLCENTAPFPEPHLFFGLDLGRRHDPSALILLERLALPTGRTDPITFQPESRLVFRLRLAHRFPLGLPYLELLRRLPLDAHIIPITITSGHHPAPDPHGGQLVPRRDLLSRLRILFESGLLRIPRSLPSRRAILEELSRLSDQPSSKHDDLALALALAAWPAARSLPFP